MVSLKLQKRLAASVLECGKNKVWLDPNEINEISMANSSMYPMLVIPFALRNLRSLTDSQLRNNAEVSWRSSRARRSLMLASRAHGVRLKQRIEHDRLM
jgi:ribosomal protein L19E